MNKEEILKESKRLGIRTEEMEARLLNQEEEEVGGN